MTEKIRLAAVDDHPLFVTGLTRALRSATDIDLVAKGECGADAIAIARDHKPDVMLIDISMPGDGISAARQITQDCPRTKVIILTASNHDEQLRNALDAGAKGFLLKGAGVAEITEAVRVVHSGGCSLAPEVASRLLVRQQEQERTKKEFQATFRQLTPREREILLLMTEGLGTKEIAERMGLSPSTVRTYTSYIFDKLQVQNRVQAVSLALGELKH